MSAGRQSLHQGGRVLAAGQPLDQASLAVILLHGRGSSAEDILGLSGELGHDGAAYLAPQASRSTWYPSSFLASIEQNEPWLTSALDVLKGLLAEVEAAGVTADRVVLGGFSQGACLSSEFVARNARRYGGLLVFSGGLIGPAETPRDYGGSLAGTPVFIGCSDVDPHIPLGRVHETTQVLREMGADVTERIYRGMPHTVVQDEIEHGARIVAAVASSS